MGKKYIITESQERILTRLVERELGPEESVLVANKNPFKYEEFDDARREYSRELKDGERFYVFNDTLFRKDMYPKLKQKFDGKTVRINDKIQTIRVQDTSNNFFSIVVDDYVLFFDTEGNLLNMEFTFAQDPKSPQHLRKVPDFMQSAFLRLYKTFLDNVQKSIKDEFKLEGIDDKYFEIREIKRNITDF